MSNRPINQFAKSTEPDRPVRNRLRIAVTLTMVMLFVAAAVYSNRMMQYQRRLAEQSETELGEARNDIEATRAGQLALNDQFDLLPMVPGLLEAWLRSITRPEHLPRLDDSAGYWFRDSIQPAQQESVSLVLPEGQYQLDLTASWDDKRRQTGSIQPTSTSIKGGKYRLVIEVPPEKPAIWGIEDAAGHYERIPLPFPGVSADGLPVRLPELGLLTSEETTLTARSWSDGQKKLSLKIICRRVR